MKKVLATLLKAYAITFATLFTLGFIYGFIQSIVDQVEYYKTRHNRITPLQFAHMKRTFRKYTTEYPYRNR